MKQNQKPCTKLKKVIDRGKRSKTLSEVKPVKNINKNLQSFLEISPVPKEELGMLLIMGAVDSVICAGSTWSRLSFSDDVLMRSEPLYPLMMYVLLTCEVYQYDLIWL